MKRAGNIEGGVTGNIGHLGQSESEDMCSGLMENQTGGNFAGSSVLIIFLTIILGSFPSSFLLILPVSCTLSFVLFVFSLVSSS